VNRETKRMMQRQGQMEADGSPSARRATGAQNQPRANRTAGRGPSGRKRTTPVQFTREIRDEMRQVAWPSRTELINYTTIVLVVLIIMIGLIFLLNLGIGKLITELFAR
jgi:preprotein translocase subunit SecE